MNVKKSEKKRVQVCDTKLPFTGDVVITKLLTIFCNNSFDSRSVMLTGSKNRKFLLLRPVFCDELLCDTVSPECDERRDLYRARLMCDSTSGMFR